MLRQVMKESWLLLCLVAAVPRLAAGVPEPHLELTLHMKAHRAEHQLPAYTRDEVVVLADEKPVAEVTIAFTVGDPRLPHTGRSVDFPKPWPSMLLWQIRDEQGKEVPGASVAAADGAAERTIVDDGTVLKTTVTFENLRAGNHYRIDATMPLGAAGANTSVSSPPAFLYVARGEESNDIRAQRLIAEAARIRHQSDFSFAEYRAVMKQLAEIPSYEFEAANGLAVTSIGRVPAAESLQYVREARAVLNDWKKGADPSRVPPGIARLWKSASAAYDSFERIYPVYSKREADLTITMEGREETTHYVLRDKRDGRVVQAQ